MTVREYIGARYVPIFIGEWDNTNTYEPLSIVSYQGDSYTSKQYVPTGIEITNEQYWAITGNYNAQVDSYRREVETLANKIPSSDFDDSNTVKKYIDDNDYQRAVVFDTVSDMINETSLKIGMICHTNGYETSGDDGASWYKIINSEETADGFYLIELDNGLFANRIEINSTLKLDDFPGDTKIDKLKNALSVTSSGVIDCGKITVDKSIDVATINAPSGRDLRTITLVNATFVFNDYPLFISTDPTSQASAVNSVPTFSNCVFKNSDRIVKNSPIFYDFNAIGPKFINCIFNGEPLYWTDITDNNNTKYVQSLYMVGCEILYMYHDFITTTNIYNLEINECRFEWGEGVLFNLSKKDAHSILQGAITNCVIEGREKPILKFAGNVEPLLVQGCYFEGNSYPYFEITASSNVKADCVFKNNWFDIEHMQSTDYVWKFNNYNTGRVLIEDNNFDSVSMSEDTYLTDFPYHRSGPDVYLRHISNNFSNSHIKMQRSDFQFTAGYYSVSLDGNDLVASMPLCRFNNLFQIQKVYEVNFFAEKYGVSQYIRDLYHCKIYIQAESDGNGGWTMVPHIFDEFKTTNGTSLALEIDNPAYNSKNANLKFTFSGFKSNAASAKLIVNNNSFPTEIEV